VAGAIDGVDLGGALEGADGADGGGLSGAAGAGFVILDVGAGGCIDSLGAAGVATPPGDGSGASPNAGRGSFGTTGRIDGVDGRGGSSLCGASFGAIGG